MEQRMNPPTGLESRADYQKFKAFVKSAALVSSKYQRLIKVYPSQWIGVYREKVVENAGTLDELIERLKERDIPLGETIIRFISEEQPMLIL